MSTFFESLSRDDMVETIVFGCGIVDGIPFSKKLLKHPFRSLFFASRNGVSWCLCVKLMRWAGFPPKLQFLIPFASIASVIYLKYHCLRQGPEDLVHPSEHSKGTQQKTKVETTYDEHENAFGSLSDEE